MTQPHDDGPAPDFSDQEEPGASAVLTQDRPYSPSAQQLAREAYRRKRSRRGGLIAAGSTVVVFAAVIAIVVTSPGWPRVKATFFSGKAFRASFPDVLHGFWLNCELFLVVEVCVLVLGLLVAVVRSTRSPAMMPFRLLAVAYTDVLRGIPTLLLVFLVGFGVPALNLTGVTNDVTVLGGFALTLSYGAYVAEVFRAGILSVHPSQRAAARALGLSSRQSLGHVVLPQAVRNVVPPLLNDFVSLQKDTALVAVLGPLEAVRQAQIYAAGKFNYTSYVAAAVLFILLTVPLARLTDHLAIRALRRQGQGGTA